MLITSMEKYTVSGRNRMRGLVFALNESSMRNLVQA